VSDAEGIHVIASRSRQSAGLDALSAALQPTQVSYLGGSLKTVEVARGRANLFLCPPSSVMHLWDMCAASAILAEAGGRPTDVYGRPIDYSQAETANHRGVVAASPVLHDAVIRRLAAALP
jgi:3'(2'), 5'-bisphosphate nucleotidase